ncbi:MAG: CesT family type III secretion system chaperone [Reinekea sp.]
MSENHYTTLIGELARNYGYDQEKLLSEEPVTINGVDFRFEHNDALKPSQLLVFCLYGNLPVERITEACVALLEANMLLFYNRGPRSVFTLSPGTDEAWLMDSYPLEELSAKELSEYLAQTADQALLWRKDYFLDD